MSTLTTFHAGLVDVFADAPLTGNPLAVVDDADGVPDDAMRRIAGEFQQAETTFILASTRADRKLRSFTASGVEVFGAGHNALGAWLWLAELGRLGAIDAPITVRQEIGDEVLPITLERRAGRVHGRMRQAPVRLLPPIGALGALAAALTLTVEEIVAPRPRTATYHLMVRVRDRAAVDRAAPVNDALRALLRDAGAEGCYVYAFDPAAPGAAYARFFNPTVGLWEDAATGTAAGPLCALLGAEGMLAADRTLVVEQGVRMGRRSLLHVRLTPDAELSGAGVIVLRGSLAI